MARPTSSLLNINGLCSEFNLFSESPRNLLKKAHANNQAGSEHFPYYIGDVEVSAMGNTVPWNLSSKT